jgi:hypothetical protein
VSDAPAVVSSVVVAAPVDVRSVTLGSAGAGPVVEVPLTGRWPDPPSWSRGRFSDRAGGHLQ